VQRDDKLMGVLVNTYLVSSFGERIEKEPNREDIRSNVTPEMDLLKDYKNKQRNQGT
jgi:hypothetical protein